MLNNKVDELKETTGNRDISTGGTTSGVTAASAIAAMQEAGSKLSRDNSKAAYRGYRKMILMVIELIRQFYDMPRSFRIMGENGAARFIQYSNANIQASPITTEFGVEMGGRKPLFDIEITAQKQSPYSKMSQNELALQFFGQGFFNPQMADQALACLGMMDFTKKDEVMQKISENGTLQEMLLLYQQMALQFANQISPELGQQVANQILGQGGMPIPEEAGAEAEIPDTHEEHPFVERARSEARASTEVE